MLAFVFWESSSMVCALSACTLSPVAAMPSSRGTSLMEFSLQALLVRHEAYMADAEKERVAITAHIDELEGEKKGLQRTNNDLVQENRGLLDQLEALNNAVAESDTQVTSLQATLQSAQQEIQKLAHLAARTESLERQLADFERDQATWQNTIDLKEEAEKSSTRRWQKAERALADLQDQLERIERESREEKERHVEVVGRMERRRVVERELSSAAGRLKGAAASKTAGREAGGTNVVSHFVKDILSDNANLQMGIVELREMLQNSNQEVENLRDQLSEHQPMEDNEGDRPQLGNRTISLDDELSRAASQELHVHHHYHAPPPGAAGRNTLRRPKKKRYGALTPGHFTPPTSGRSTPRSSISYSTPSSVATILQQTAVSVPQPVSTGKRWSTYSNQTYASLASSPQSATNRTSSIFDRVFSDAGQDSSRPTTPDTEEPGSPYFAPTHSKRASASSFRTFSAPLVSRKGISPGQGRPSLDSIASVEHLLPLEHRSSSHDAILEETEGDWEHAVSPSLDEGSSALSPNFEAPPSLDVHDPEFYSHPRAPLRRATSHESLLSVNGMDIHTLRDRPSQLMLPSHGTVSSGAVVSNAQAHAARPTMSTQRETSSRSILRGMAADQRIASADRAQPPSQKTVARKASGWIFGRWGATPAPIAEETMLTKSDAARPESVKSGGSKTKVDPDLTSKKPKSQMRPPGINQSGPIMGFLPEVKVSHPPIVRKMDQDELSSALGNAQ